MEEADPRHLLVKIAKILDELGIPYLITGGIAVLVWGRPRFTADVDVVVELRLEDLGKLAGKLKELEGYVDESELRRALEREDEFNFIDANSGIKVDFWILKSDAFDRSRLDRRQRKEFLGYKIAITSPEDLILIKLQWYKNSGSSRHLEDVESIIAISGDKLDFNYLEEWVGRLRLTEEFNQLKKK